MFRHNLKIALRNILKYWNYSIINIGGLAIGLASFIFIVLYINDELKYDNYHENADRIYRVNRLYNSNDVDEDARPLAVRTEVVHCAGHHNTWVRGGELFELGGTVSCEEGCLSVPGITTKIRRTSKMGIRAQDTNGKEFEQEADKLLSRVWQHEFDHCSGLLIIDRMSRLQRIAHRRAIRELEDAYKSTK